MALQNGEKGEDDRLTAASPPLLRMGRGKSKREDTGLGWHRIKPAYLFECVLRLCLVTLPRIVFRKYPAVPRLVSFGFMYLMLQLLGIHYAFLINAATTIALDVSGYAVARAFDSTGFGVEETVAAVASAYTFYASLRLVTHFGSHIAAVAWGCVDDFPEVRKIVVLAGARPFLLPVLFLPQLALAALLVAAPTACDPFNAEIASAGGGHPFSLGFDPVLAGARWRQGATEWSRRAAHFCCTRTPVMYLSRPYERPRQTLQLLLTISLLQYLQVLLQRYPSWRRDLRKAGLRQRLALHFGLLANATLTALWTLRWAAHCLGLDVLHWWPVADYMNAGLVLVLLWTAFLAVLARCLSVAATSDGPDVDSLREYMAMVKMSFLAGCCAVFCRGCLHPEMGFLMAQEEVTILTVAMPMLYVLTFMMLEACLGVTRRLLLLGPVLLAVATIICRISRFGGPGTLLLVWLHLFRKAIEHFGATVEDAAAEISAAAAGTDRRNALAAAGETATAAAGGTSAEAGEDEGESVLMAAYKEALSFLKAEAAAAAAEAAASGSELGSNISAADAFAIADAAETLSIPDETAFSSSVDGNEDGGTRRDSEDISGASAFDDITISLAAVGGGNGDSSGSGGASGSMSGGGGGSDAGGHGSGGSSGGENGMRHADSVCYRASGDLSPDIAANDNAVALEGPLGWDSCMVALAETEGVTALTKRWQNAASNSTAAAATTPTREASAPASINAVSPGPPAAARAATPARAPVAAAASEPTMGRAAAASPTAEPRLRAVGEPGNASPAAHASDSATAATTAPEMAPGLTNSGINVTHDVSVSRFMTPRRETTMVAASAAAGSGSSGAMPALQQQPPPLLRLHDKRGISGAAGAMIASASPVAARESATSQSNVLPALAAVSSSGEKRGEGDSERNGYVAPWWAFWDSRRHHGGGVGPDGRRNEEEGKAATEVDSTMPPSPLRVGAGALGDGSLGNGHSNGTSAAAATGEAGDCNIGDGGGGSGGSTALAIGSALLAARQRGRESLSAALAALVARMEAAAAPNTGRFSGSNGSNGSHGGGADGLASPGWLRGVQQAYEETDTRFLYRSLVSVAALILLALGSSVALGGFLSHIQERVRFFPNFMAINSTATGQVVISHAFASTAVLETKGPAKMEEPSYAACGVRWHGLSLVDYALLAEMAYVELDRAGPERRDALVQMLFPRDAGFDFELRLPAKEFNGGRPRASFFEAYSPSLNLSVISIRGTDLGRVGDFLEDWKTWVSPMVISCLSTLFPTIQIWPKETTAAVVLWMDETLEVFGVQPRPDYFRPLVQYVRGIGREGSGGGAEGGETPYEPRQVVLTGHSLGGGLARIVGALERKSSICFSPPGVAQSYRKFRVDGAMLDRRFLLHTTVSVIPENDLVTKIDTQVGLIQTIQCATSSKALQNSCHMLEGTLCDLVRHCGDDRGRFSDCNYIFDVGRAWPVLWDMMRGGWQFKDFFA